MAWRRASVVVAGSHAAALAGALEVLGAVSTDITDADAGGSESGRIKYIND